MVGGVFSRKKAWLVTAAVVGFIYLAVYITRLFIPLLQPVVDPYDDRTMWLYALAFLPFVFVLGLFLLTAVLRKLAKFATFFGVLVVYAPLVLMIINNMATIIFFPILYLLLPLFELENLLQLGGQLSSSTRWLSKR